MAMGIAGSQLRTYERVGSDVHPSSLSSPTPSARDGHREFLSVSKLRLTASAPDAIVARRPRTALILERVRETVPAIALGIVDTTMESNKSKTLFLLGAGASYGHREEPGPDTPPLAKDFLVEACRQGVLNSKDFPQLASQIIDKSGKTDLLDGCEALRQMGQTIELFLDSVQKTSKDTAADERARTQSLEQWRRGAISHKESFEYPRPTFVANFALESGRFFIQSFIGRFCKADIDEGSAYRWLSRFIGSHMENVAGVMTLNYDTICESALRAEDVEYDYNLTVQSHQALPFLKPHGSTNFRFSMKGIASLGNATNWQGYVTYANSIIEGLRDFRPNMQIEVYQPKYSLESDFWVEKNKPMSHFPVLVPPLVEKRYDQVYSYNYIWAKLKQLLAETDSLVVIGCRMHPNETRLWQYLGQHLGPETTITIVGSSSSGLSEVEGEFRQQGFKNVSPLHRVNGFYDYALRYLGNGRLR